MTANQTATPPVPLEVLCRELIDENRRLREMLAQVQRGAGVDATRVEMVICHRTGNHTLLVTRPLVGATGEKDLAESIAAALYIYGQSVSAEAANKEATGVGSSSLEAAAIMPI